MQEREYLQKEITPGTNLSWGADGVTLNADVPSIEANPQDTATDTLSKLELDGTVYDLSNIEANPADPATDTLTTINIDGTVYDFGATGDFNHIYEGPIPPNDEQGEDRSLYMKFEGTGQESASVNVWSGSIGSSYYYPTWNKVGDFNPFDYYSLTVIGNGAGRSYNTSNKVATIAELSKNGYYWNVDNRVAFKIENNSFYFIQIYGSGSSTLTTVNGTTKEYTATDVKDLYGRVGDEWFKIPKGTKIEMNPSGTATETATKIAVTEDIQDVYLNNGKIAEAGSYIYCNLDKNMVAEKLYHMTVRDGNNTYTTDFIWDGTTNVYPLNNNNLVISVEQTQVGATYYTGSYRDMYCDITCDDQEEVIYAFSGSGGSATLASLNDVDLTSPSTGQVLTYDAVNQEWVNAAPTGIMMYSGTTTPSNNIGQNNDVYIKYDGQNIETSEVLIFEEYIQRYSYEREHRTIDVSQKYHVRIKLKNTQYEQTVLASDIYPTGSVMFNTNLGVIINGTDWTLKNATSDGYTFQVYATELEDSIPTNINTPYAKLHNTWFSFPKGSEVEANPSGTGSTDLTKVAIDGVVYDIPSGGGSSVEPNPQDIPTDTLNTIKIDDTTYNISGSGGANLIIDAQRYSTDEKVVGVWLDGKPIYQKTFEFNQQVSIPSSEWTYLDNTAITNLGFKISIMAQDQNGTVWDNLGCNYENNKLGIWNTRNTNLAIKYLTVTYTKTTDSAGSGGYQAYGFSPVIYSTEEREIGVWVDNKPLYCKAYNLGSSGVVVPTNEWTTLVSNIGTEKQIKGGGCVALGGLTCYDYISLTQSSGNLNCLQLRNATISVGIVYIYYTKSTDTAGSGSYNTLGVPNVHYTTAEQVIGTWVDGKPLYQRTFDLRNVTFNDKSWNNHILGTYESGIKIRTFEGKFGLSGYGDIYADYNYFRSTNEYFTAATTTTDDDINVRPNMNAGTVKGGIVTIRYTKNSD